jgi:hypothetical protein
MQSVSLTGGNEPKENQATCGISLTHLIYIRLCRVCISTEGPSWSWSYGSWIYNNLCNQCLSPLCDKVYQWLAKGRWFSTGTPLFSTNKTDLHHITEILLKVALSTINLQNQPIFSTTVIELIALIDVNRTYQMIPCTATQ